jgi:hypothetical protein
VFAQNSKLYGYQNRYSETVVSTIFFTFPELMMKAKSSSITETDLNTKIKEAYLDYVLTEGKNPTSVYHFAKNAGFQESDFYQWYNTFDAVAQDVWESVIKQVLATLSSSDEYAGFSVREKILSFYFTLVQELKKNRSYVSYSASKWAIPGRKDSVRSAVEKQVQEYFEKQVQEGFDSGELLNRSKVGDYYSKAMVIQFWLVLDFWIKDSSRDFEDTDAFIEKTVHLAFGLMQESTLDKAIDLVRFLAGRVSLV